MNKKYIISRMYTSVVDNKQKVSGYTKEIVAYSMPYAVRLFCMQMGIREDVSLIIVDEDGNTFKVKVETTITAFYDVVSKEEYREEYVD